MNRNERKATVQDTQDRTETGQEIQAVAPVRPSGRKRALPKDHSDHWSKKLKKRTWRTPDGVVAEIPEWQVRLFNAGREGWFNLGTANKAAAAVKARDIHEHLRAHGWELTLEKFKPGREEQKSVVTVGEFLTEVKAKAGLRPKTLEDYCRAFRTIIASVEGIDGGKAKFDYFGGGRDKWLAKVHAVKLSEITPPRVQKWKLEFLSKAASDPIKQRSAKVSVNSLIRQAKSLFSPKILEFITLEMPEHRPFEGVAFESRPSMRYRSSFVLEDVIRLACYGDAGEGIAPLPDEQRKIFLLAIMAGLRRNEIDKLEWAAFRWEDCTIRIEATANFHPKSEDSAGDIEVDSELMSAFRGFHAKATNSKGFVIESTVAVRSEASYSHYRCQREFDALMVWLRANGVTGQRPLHTLRKEFGSQMCALHGIYAASHALRHGDITITSQHYLDKRKRSSPGLGRLMEAGSARLGEVA
jgi:integrase